MELLEFTRFETLDYACTEALNTLCTNLSFAGSRYVKIMVTSHQPGEGKSFITMNMMRTLADLGKKVVMVDADLRRSTLSTRYGIRTQNAQSRGLTHYLAGMCEIDDVLHKTDIDGAYIVPMRHEVSNSLSLLNTPRLAQLLNELAEDFDFVLVDAPPVGVLIDAAEIARFCDGTLLVVSYNTVRRKELNECKRQIELAGCKVLGAVLNKMTFDTYSSKKYYNKSYYSYYSPEKVQARKKAREKNVKKSAESSSVSRNRSG